MPYIQKINGKRYILVAVIQSVLDGLTFVKGADVYDQNGNYKGYWRRENFPSRLEHYLLEYVRRTNVQVPKREFDPLKDARGKKE